MANDTRKQYTEASSLPALESVSGNEKVLTLTANGNAANATPVKDLMAGVFKAAQEAASPSTGLYVDLSDAQGNVVSRVKLSDLFTLAAGAGETNGLLKIVNWSNYVSANDLPSGSVVSIPSSSGMQDIPANSNESTPRQIIMTLGWMTTRLQQISIYIGISGGTIIKSRLLTGESWSEWT